MSRSGNSPASSMSIFGGSYLDGLASYYRGIREVLEKLLEIDVAESLEIPVNERQSAAVVYAFPRSVAEAVQLLAEGAGEARIVAGGTDVLPAIRKNEIRPRCLVDITRIPGLDQIEELGDWIVIGPNVTFRQIKESSLLQEQARVLVEAAASGSVSKTSNTASISC
mgnify:CR=1 FL=1